MCNEDTSQVPARGILPNLQMIPSVSIGKCKPVSLQPEILAEASKAAQRGGPEEACTPHFPFKALYAQLCFHSPLVACRLCKAPFLAFNIKL